MSENVNSQTSKSISFMDRKDWFVLLTGGLVSSGAIGWLMYKDFNPQQHNSKAVMTVLASFAGGMGIYFTGSALVSMWRKPRDSEELTTFRSDPSDLTAVDDECNLCEMFANLVIDLERNLAFEASKEREFKGSNKEILSNIIQEAADVPCRSEDINNKLNDFKSKVSRAGLKLRIDNQIETHSNEGIVGRARCKEEIITYINELKGSMLGAIDPLPLVRNIQIQLTGMSDEKRRKVITMVKENLNNMVTKFEQTMNEFVDSVCKDVDVTDVDQEYKVKKASEILGVSEKDKTTSHMKIEMDQNCNVLENSTQSKSQTPSCQSGQRPKFIYGANMQPLTSISSPSLHRKTPSVQTSECSLPVMPNLASPTSTDIPFNPKEASKSGNLTFEKPKILSSDPPVKLSLTQEQMNLLNLLKSEI